MTVHALADVQDPVREARIDLAAIYRLGARLGFDDTIWNHFTMRMPGRSDQFLVKPHGLLFSEITASNLIIVDTDGNTVEGHGVAERSSVCIHAAVHTAVPRANCVLHSHMRHATWLGMIENGRLLPVHQNGLRFYGRVSYDDHYNGLAIEREEGARIAGFLVGNDLLILANHGVIAVGPSVAEAFYDLYYFEVSCEEQYMIACSGQRPRLIPHEIAEKTAKQYREGESGAPFEYLTAMKRLLAKEEPDYLD